jgi:hypothetical protein
MSFLLPFVCVRISRFSSKCGVKSMDLDKNASIFVQKWGKKYRFGQKSLFASDFYLASDLFATL